jgi:hypothetical protein
MLRSSSGELTSFCGTTTSSWIPGVGVGAVKIGWGIPVLGFELVELHPGGFLVLLVVGDALDVGNGLDQFRAQLILLSGAQASFD